MTRVGNEPVCWKTLLIAVVLGNRYHGSTQVGKGKRGRAAAKVDMYLLLALKLAFPQVPKAHSPYNLEKAVSRIHHRDICIPN